MWGSCVWTLLRVTPQRLLFGLLVSKLCDLNAGSQVHESVLRLLLAASKTLPPEQLGRYLQSTIQNSRKSRR